MSTIEPMVLFAYLIIHLFRLVFSVGTVFFSHNKSAETVFRLVFSAKRMRPINAKGPSSGRAGWMRNCGYIDRVGETKKITMIWWALQNSMFIVATGSLHVHIFVATDLLLFFWIKQHENAYSLNSFHIKRTLKGSSREQSWKVSPAASTLLLRGNSY